MKFLTPLLFLCFMISPSIYAQIYVKQDASGMFDGTSWENAYNDLQNALEVSEPGTQIWVAEGTYVPKGFTPEESHFIALYPVEVYGGFAGNETSLEQRDWTGHPTIISGDREGDDITGDFINNRSDNAFHTLIIDAGEEQSIIDGIVFSGGATLGFPYSLDEHDIPYERYVGGALYINNTNTIVRNCIFQDNDGLGGSGIFASGGGNPDIQLIIEKSIFKFNNGYNAAGAYLRYWNSVNVRDCRFYHNIGSRAGALSIVNSMADITNCIFENNLTDNTGGACLIVQGSPVILYRNHTKFSQNIFSDNTTYSEGGGIFFANYEGEFQLEIDSCSFFRNHGFYGGAVCIYDLKDTIQDESGSRVSLTNSTFDQNTAYAGGALEVWGRDDSIQVQLIHNNFLDNSCPGGNGGAFELYIDNTSLTDLYMKGNLFENNSANTGGAMDLIADHTSFTMKYFIDSCSFRNNYAEQYGGGLFGRSNYNKNEGKIINSDFINNQGKGSGGGIFSFFEDLTIDNCLFSGNYTEGDNIPNYNGGAGASFIGFINPPAEIKVRNTIFDHNISAREGSALLTHGKEYLLSTFENVLFHDNDESSVIQNGAQMKLINTTFYDNFFGLYLKASSSIEIQNSIFKNEEENLFIEGSSTIISKGGNISSDDSMVPFLTGSGSYPDLNLTDPLLGPDYAPMTESPCIDAGNPDGVQSIMDLAGNPRIQGDGIDIGAYERFTVSTQNINWDSTLLKVYPNPSKDAIHFTLNAGQKGSIKIQIYSYDGKLVQESIKEQNFNGQEFKENIFGLSPGMYTLLVKTQTGNFASHIAVVN